MWLADMFEHCVRYDQIELSFRLRMREKAIDNRHTVPLLTALPLRARLNAQHVSPLLLEEGKQISRAAADLQHSFPS
ncbi:hypothetical protein L536_0129 [Bordetella bronchiseptica SO10328]|nr:hypothetical protein L536_0129 [Bordetella bronchiseptica SO10328]